MELLRVRDEELLPFGVEVQYHHRAGVARFKKRADDRDEGRRGWVITEGIAYHNETIPLESDSRMDLLGVNDQWDNRVKYVFYRWPQAKMGFSASFDNSWRFESYNKTIMLWPEDGFGWLIGKIRKSIGVSERQSYIPASYYGDADYDSGGHASDMMVDLYVVKRQYEGTNFIYCPWWAVKKAS